MELPSDLPESTYALLRRSAQRHGGNIALSFFLEAASHRKCEHMSYARLFAEVTRTANFLHRLGAGAGDVTALMLPNLPETHVALWGGEAAGVVMPVNPLLEPSAIAALLSAAKAKVLVTLAPFPGVDLYDKAVEIAAGVPTLRHVVLVDMTGHVPGVKRFAARLLAGRARRRAPAMPAHVRVHRFDRAVRRQPAGRLLSGRRIEADNAASYFCTGGTTGLPKIAVRTHGQEVANAWMITSMLGDVFTEESTIFCGLPLFHVNAVIATGLAPFLIGARALLGTPQGYRGAGLVARFWEIAAHHRIMAFSGVPTLLNMLLEQPRGGHDLSALRIAFSGAAPLSAELLRRFEQSCGIAVVEAYGLTETACAASMNPPEGEHRAGSVGLPLPAQSIRTVILDGAGRFLRDAGQDEIGVVAIAGPNVFSGYLDPQHDAGLWIDRGDGRRWLNTGDLGRFDAEGYLWLTGRAKDLIIRGGHNIDPSVIEDALAAHPLVALAAAVGRPDAHAGEVPVAYVQLVPGADTDAATILAEVAPRIGERAAVPKQVILVDQLPLTPIGKIHKPTLRLRELEQVAREMLGDAGVAFDAVEAVADERRGSVVRIHARADEAGRISETLRAFAFVHELAAPVESP